jgi:AraC-like DNA-binding protein
VDRGAAWLILPDAVPMALVGGDVVLLPHGHAHTLADEPGRPPRLVDFEHHPQIAHGGGPAMWGGGGARTLLVCGEFHVEGPQLQPLLGELPPCILLRAGEASQWLTMTLRVLAHEALGMEPGADLIMERLVEVIFVQCIRGWLRTGVLPEQGWLQALRDPHIARALSLIHQRPAQQWTVEELARGVGMSRSMFAERFTKEVGEPPLTYLTRWRMQLSGARLVASPSEPLKSIATAVGYHSEAAWNRAFRRFAGQPPAHWRELQSLDASVHGRPRA